MSDTEAPICEIFDSIQGEGKNIGRPSIFIRFWGCNLRCQFNDTKCDTPYAVVTKGEEVRMYSVEETVNYIMNSKLNNVVLTGGEPMLYQPFINNIILKVREHKVCDFEIETNGTIRLMKGFKYFINLFTLSIKLKSSKQESEIYEKTRINYGALKTYPADRSVFKFVIVNEDDIKEIEEIMSKLILFKPKFADCRIFFMPEGQDTDSIINNGKWLVGICVKLNMYYSPREHIILFGKKRGV